MSPFFALPRWAVLRQGVLSIALPGLSGYLEGQVNEQVRQEDPLLGELVSERYRILRRIGEGGMGTVYEAMHESIEKRVALKVLRSEYSSSATVVARFKQEAISASRIKHQNVIDVFDFGQLEDGSCYIAMEYLEGKDLGDLLHEGHSFSPERAVAIGISVCRALSLAHARGVVHRDLKPENVFIQVTPEGDECVKIVDFGIAQLRKADEPVVTEERRRRLTKTGMIFGTPEYMAPEQARGQDVDERSDIYALGVILYELVSGAVPFVGETFLEVLNAHNALAVPPLSVINPNVEISDRLWRVITRALEKDPEDRFQTMGDFSLGLLSCEEAGTGSGEMYLPKESDPVGERDPVRLENSSYPAASKETAMFGSPGALYRDEDTPESGESRSRKMVLFVVLVSLLALGAVGYFLVERATTSERAEGRVGSDPEVPEPTNEVDEADAPQELSNPTAPSVEPVEEPDDGAEDNELGQVVLSVESDPTGAVVSVDGFQVCDQTPCEVRVKSDQPVVLTARKGNSVGEAKVLAQSSQEVLVTLQRPSVPVAAPKPAPQRNTQPPPPSAGPALCEVMVDGIKILRPCK